MKKNSFYYLLTLIAIVSMVAVGCKKKEENKPTESEIFIGSLTAADTTAIKDISDKFMATLQKGDIDGAVSQLVMVDTAGNVQPLPKETLESVKSTFELFPVLSYTIQDYQFIDQENNYVAYTFVAKEATADKPEMTMGFRTKPVKIGGKWHLTLPDYTHRPQNDSIQ